MGNEHLSKYVVWWFSILAGAVFIMVLIGGYTRLSHAGLSIVEWKPVVGTIPPMSSEQWQEEFQKYQQTPEFKQVNMDMSLEEFKKIFWIEFVHRLWGRLIGFLFLLPLFFFWWRGAFTKPIKYQVVLVGVLGSLQACMGWYMVKSGLTKDPMVSPYRLAAHLLLALAIMSVLIRSAMCARSRPKHIATHFRQYGEMCLVLLCITIFYGALVAGMRAGLIYNTFPLMDGVILPADAWFLTPMYRNFFENPTMVQFMHRVLAFFSFCAVILWGIKGYKNLNLAPMKKWFVLLWGIMGLQFCLGILTLLSGVPMHLALAHQAVAFVLFPFVLFLVLQTRRI